MAFIFTSIPSCPPEISALLQVNRDLVKQRRNARLFQKTEFTGAGNNGEKKTRGNGLDMLKRLENELGSHKGAVLPLLQVRMQSAKGLITASVFLPCDSDAFCTGVSHMGDSW